MVSLIVSVAVNPDRPRGELQARTSVRNLAGVQRLQRLCQKFGIPPTYLLSYAVAARPEAEWFAQQESQGLCEIGAAFQPWNTPPFEPTEERLVPRPATSLTTSAVRAKLTALTDAIENRTGVRPQVHRSAGGGLDGATLQALERLGYLADSTAMPFVDAREGGGTDWRTCPRGPYHPDRQRPVRRGGSPILEIPVTIGWDRNLPHSMARVPSGFQKSPFERLLSNGWYHLASVSMLEPSMTPLDTMCRVADVALRDGIPVLHLPLDSETLVAGESARCPEPDDVRQLFEALDGFLRYAIDVLRAMPETMGAYARQHIGRHRCTWGPAPIPPE